jgi:hypothetical protein
MGSVTFYEGIDYTGNSRTYNIEDTSFYNILLYEDANTPIKIRSIKNNTDNKYYISLYYKNGENAFGGSYINIISNLEDLNDVMNAKDLFEFGERDPLFYGIVLHKKFPHAQAIYKVVLPNFNWLKAYDIDDVSDMREEFILINTEQTSTEETDDSYNRCLEYNKQRQKSIDIFHSRIALLCFYFL